MVCSPRAWRVFFLCLAWLAVTVIAKSEAGSWEKIAQYGLYMIMYKYTTSEDGKPPPGVADDPKAPDFWKRDKMPMLPFRVPTRPSQITNRGNKDPARGRESEMVSQSWTLCPFLVVSGEAPSLKRVPPLQHFPGPYYLNGRTL